MKFGLVMFPTDYSIGPAELAKAVEERGFESLFFPEHTHIPASRRSPWPGGAELPAAYSHIIDQFVALGTAGAVTRRLKLGTGICLVVQYDPITLAKQVASLDFVSQGRLMFGVGGGWNLEEMENHGMDPRLRWKIMRERIQAMKAIWSQEEAEYHGRFVDFDSIWSWPKPVQKPHPPILVGGAGAHTFQRVLEYGDGWMPIPGRGGRPLSEQVEELNRLTAEAGRDPVPVTVYGVPGRREAIDEYREIGIERCVFSLPSAPRDEILPLLDRYAGLVQSFS